MEINSYNFIEDVQFYLSNFIAINSFKVYNDFETDLNQTIILENKSIKIWFTTLESFPYQSITFKMYYHNKIIKTKDVLVYWGLTIKDFDKIFSELDKSIPYPSNSEFKGYQKNLLVIESLIKNYYYPMLPHPPLCS